MGGNEVLFKLLLLLNCSDWRASDCGEGEELFNPRVIIIIFLYMLHIVGTHFVEVLLLHCNSADAISGVY